MVILKDEKDSKKATILDDNASIYQKREAKTERQKFREMKTFQEKLNYCKLYYLKPTLVGIVLVGLFIYLVYSIVSPKDKFLLNVAMADYITTEEMADKMANDFIEAEGITLGEHEKIRFDTHSYYLSGGDPSTITMFATHLMAGELDVLVAPESLFRNYAFNGATASLTDELPSDLYGALTDRFYFCKISENSETYEESTSEEYVLGVYLDGTPFWEQYKEYFRQDERPVLGIVANSKNKELAIRLVRYLFEE